MSKEQKNNNELGQDLAGEKYPHTPEVLEDVQAYLNDVRIGKVKAIDGIIGKPFENRAKNPKEEPLEQAEKVAVATNQELETIRIEELAERARKALEDLKPKAIDLTKNLSKFTADRAWEILKFSTEIPKIPEVSTFLRRGGDEITLWSSGFHYQKLITVKSDGNNIHLQLPEGHEGPYFITCDGESDQARFVTDFWDRKNGNNQRVIRSIASLKPGEIIKIIKKKLQV